MLKTCTANPASTVWNVVKTLLYTAAVWTVFVAGIPFLLWLTEQHLSVSALQSDFFSTAGLVLLAAGTLLYLSSGLTLAIYGKGTPWYCDCSRELVIRGAYRHVRNPMDVGFLIQGIGVAFVLGSPLVLIYAVAASVVTDFLVRPWEQADLKRRFGGEYETYRRRVRCWRPRFVPYDPAREDSEPAIAAEATTAPGRHVLLYDGHCRFCQMSAKRLLWVADGKKIDLVSFQDPGALDRFPGISYEACMQQMFLVTPTGRVYGGFEAAVHAVATRPILGSVAFVYYLPGLRWLLDSIYSLVAKIRYHILGRKIAQGECDEGTCAVHFGGTDSKASDQTN